MLLFAISPELISLCLKATQCLALISGESSNSQTGVRGANPQGGGANLLLPEKWMKMKEIGSRGERRIP